MDNVKFLKSYEQDRLDEEKRIYNARVGAKTQKTLADEEMLKRKKIIESLSKQLIMYEAGSIFVEKEKEKEYGKIFALDEEDEKEHQGVYVFTSRENVKKPYTAKKLISKMKAEMQLAKDNGFMSIYQRYQPIYDNICILAGKERQNIETKKNLAAMLDEIDNRQNEDFLVYENIYQKEEESIQNWEKKIDAWKDNAFLYTTKGAKKVAKKQDVEKGQYIRPFDMENIKKKYEVLFGYLDKLQEAKFITKEQAEQKREAMKDELELWQARTKSRELKLQGLERKEKQLGSKLQQIQTSKPRKLVESFFKVLTAPAWAPVKGLYKFIKGPDLEKIKKEAYERELAKYSPEMQTKIKLYDEKLNLLAQERGNIGQR